MYLWCRKGKGREGKRREGGRGGKDGHSKFGVCVCVVSHSARLALASSVKEVCAGALRVLRYLLTSKQVLDVMLALRVDLLVTRCEHSCTITLTCASSHSHHHTHTTTLTITLTCAHTCIYVTVDMFFF